MGEVLSKNVREALEKKGKDQERSSRVENKKWRRAR
jgi:hypothetical protein